MDNQDKFERQSVISDTSTVLLDISKLEFNLDKLEALANAEGSDVESDIDIDISDISDENIDLENNVIPRIPVRNDSRNDEEFKTRRYSRYINYDILTPTKTPENEKITVNQKQILRGNENKAREANFVNENVFNEISANPRGLGETIVNVKSNQYINDNKSNNEEN